MNLRQYADYLWHADDLEQADLEETCRRLRAAEDLIEQQDRAIKTLSAKVDEYIHALQKAERDSWKRRQGK